MRKGQLYLSRPYAFVNVNFHLFWHASKLRILYQANFLYRNKKGFFQFEDACYVIQFGSFSTHLLRPDENYEIKPYSVIQT